MATYEYKTIKLDRKGVFKAKIDPDVELNKLGAEGWELVTTYVIGPGVAGNDEVFYTFKRTK